MSIVIRKGDCSDTEKFINLLQDVRESMEHKEWFYLDEPEDVRSMMENGTMRMWVAMDGDRMAAALDILYPGLEEYNYGYNIGLTEEQLRKVIHMDSAAVHPEYRGLGLQRKLIQEAESEISGTGERILLCTVHPENCFSLQNVLKQGYTIQKELAQYGSVRFILRKDII